LFPWYRNTGLTLPWRPVHIKPGRNLSTNITTPLLQPVSIYKDFGPSNPSPEDGMVALIAIRLSYCWPAIYVRLPDGNQKCGDSVSPFKGKKIRGQVSATP